MFFSLLFHLIRFRWPLDVVNECRARRDDTHTQHLVYMETDSQLSALKRQPIREIRAKELNIKCDLRP